MPGGITLETPPIFRPHDRLVALERMFTVLAPAMAAMGPFFTVLAAIMAIIDMIKALATLNPVAIGDAMADFVNAVDKLIGLLPQTSLPLFIVGVLYLVIDVLAEMITFLQRIVQLQSQVASMRDFALAHGFTDMYQDSLCLDRNLQSEMEYFNSAMGALAAFTAIITLLGSFAGLTIELDTSVDPDTPIEQTIDALAEMINTVRTIIEAIPLP
jgi:hypothetical protein